MLKELALAAALATAVIHNVWGYSLLWSVPVFIGFFIATQAYRMLIFERFVSPLTKLPGPGVCNRIRPVLITGTLVLGSIQEDYEG